MKHSLDLSRLIRVLNDETGLVFEAVIVSEDQEKVRLRLNGLCVHEQPLPVRDELAVAEALPKHLHINSNTLEDRFLLSRLLAKEASDSHSRLRHAMHRSGPDASSMMDIDDLAGSLFDLIEMRSTAIFFSLSDTEVRAVMRSLQA